MKDFFKMMFASTLGVIIASLILSILSIIVFVGVAASFSSTPAYNLTKDTVLKIDLNGAINEQESQSPMSFMFGNAGKSSGLNDIVSAIEKAKENEKIRGIYLKAEMPYSGYASMEPVRRALLDFKESGKFIVAYGEMISQRSYYVASVSDRIFLNPQGMFEFMGMGSVRQYNKDVFKKMGVDIQVFKVGTYKSAVEPFTQLEMSEANREQVSSYLNSIWGRMLDGISESRNIPVEQLNRYADECLVFTEPDKIVEYGLVDELGYGSDVEKYIKGLLELKEDDKLKLATVKNMKTVPEASKKEPKDRIAVLYAEGNIIGDAETAFTSGITAKQFVKELRDLQKDDKVKAVVFRVNSPGGSAYASEQIWNGVRELKAVKPVVVSMGDYAASGGYYISCGATKIVAEPSTLTGSIGIFAMIPSGEQIAQKMGARYDGVGTNKHSLFGGGAITIPYLELGLLPARQFNGDESAILQAYIERGYDSFIGRCAEGRGMSKEDIDKIGQGRVWTGSQALELGLVDTLGGMNIALKLAAEAAGIEEYTVVEYPEQKDFFTRMLEESMSGAKINFLKAILGKEEFLLKQEMNAWKGYDIRQAVMEEFIN